MIWGTPLIAVVAVVPAPPWWITAAILGKSFPLNALVNCDRKTDGQILFLTRKLNKINSYLSTVSFVQESSIIEFHYLKVTLIGSI